LEHPPQTLVSGSNESLPFYIVDESMTEPHFKVVEQHNAKYTKKLVILMTRGIESEPSSVTCTIAISIALGGLKAGLKVSIFLADAAIDLVRRSEKKFAQDPAFENLAAMIADFQNRGGVIWACPPCVKARGYEQADLLDGVIITGASTMNTEISDGAAALSF
jgi:predicted peroxiredoxin